MTAFGLVMLGKLVFLVVFVCFWLLLRLYVSSVFSLILNIFIFFRLHRQMSTRCSSAKALSFWREERSHSPSDAGIMTD